MVFYSDDSACKCLCFCLHLPSTEHGGEQSWKATPKVTPKVPPWCCWPLLGVGWASHFPSEHMWQKRQRVSSETEAEASVCLALCSLSLVALSHPSWRGQLPCWKTYAEKKWAAFGRQITGNWICQQAREWAWKRIWAPFNLEMTVAPANTPILALRDTLKQSTQLNHIQIPDLWKWRQ